MILNELTPQALDAACKTIGDGPVAMVNLLWFKERPHYPDGFAGAKQSSREAYYQGYAGAIRAVAADLGIEMELVYAGDRLSGLLAGPDEDWDDIAIVRYRSLDDLRRIVETKAYQETAQPHRLAAIANWRFFATKSK